MKRNLSPTNPNPVDGIKVQFNTDIIQDIDELQYTSSFDEKSMISESNIYHTIVGLASYEENK